MNYFYKKADCTSATNRMCMQESFIKINLDKGAFYV
jgi:hypothetical protein